MQTHRRALGSLLALAIVVSVATPARAGAPTDQVKRHVDEVLRILNNPALRNKPAERQAQIRKVAEVIFDYSDTARRALGTHWNARTPQEKEEFVRLFADVLDRGYISKINLYQGEAVRYVGEVVDGGEATVKTKIATKSGTDVLVDYRLHLKDGRWLVYDVIIEGASLVANYRSQFNRVVQTESYPALVQRLKTKEAEPAASPGRRERRSDR